MEGLIVEQRSYDPESPDTLLSLIRQRRVTRVFSEDPLERRDLERLAEAAYWAPNGGGRRPVRVVGVSEPRQLRRVLAVSPGIIGNPTAVLALCIDWSRAPHLEANDSRDTHSLHVDIGAAMTHMLLMAEAMDVGACPVMSFHRPSICGLLDMPSDWTPLILVTLGRRVAPPPHRDRPPADLTTFLSFERVPPRSTSDV